MGIRRRILETVHCRGRQTPPSTSRAFVVIGGSAAQTPAQAANFDGDSTVGFGDFLVFAGGFGKTSDDPEFDSRLDLDGDGQVGFTDFLQFAAVFGRTL